MRDYGKMAPTKRYNVNGFQGHLVRSQTYFLRPQDSGKGYEGWIEVNPKQYLHARAMIESGGAHKKIPSSLDRLTEILFLGCEVTLRNQVPGNNGNPLTIQIQAERLGLIYNLAKFVSLPLPKKENSQSSYERESVSKT